MMQGWSASAGSLSLGSLLSRVGSDAAYIDEPEEKAIPPLLESRYQEEKIEGLKRTIALINLGKDVSEYFPHVVKNVATPSLEVKKLVYIYLVHYAEKRPDEALLAINTLQKDLSSSDPVVRALALRALTGIRVRVAAPLAVLAVQKCARDASAYVRRCTTLAALKVHSLDPLQYGEPMEAVLAVLMADNNPTVVSSAALALHSVAPEKLGHFARHFPRLCQMLPDLDEWGQIVMLDALLRCAKILFPDIRNLDESANEDGSAGQGSNGMEQTFKEAASSSETHEQGEVIERGESQTASKRTEAQEREISSDQRDSSSKKPLDQRKSNASSSTTQCFQFASVDSFYAEANSANSLGGQSTAENNPLPAVVRQAPPTTSPLDNTDALLKRTESPLKNTESPLPGAENAGDSAPPEVRLLLYCSAPLLSSQNSGVVLAAATLHWHLAPTQELTRVIKPLTFLLRSSPRETQYPVLCAVSSMARERPFLFRGHFRRFLVRAGDPLFVRALELDVLVTVAGKENVHAILKELQVYATDTDPAFIVLVARALGRLARQLPDVAATCVQGLLSLGLGLHKLHATLKSGADEKAHSPNKEAGSSEQMSVEAGQKSSAPPKEEVQPLGSLASQDNSVVSESITVLCGLVRERPNEFASAALKLIVGLERLHVSEARTAVIALLGDLCQRGGVWTSVVPVVFRFTVASFVNESDSVKIAVLELASKYWLSLDSQQQTDEGPLLHHVFMLAKYDASIDVRDRSRFLRHLLEVHGLGFTTVGTARDSEGDSKSSDGLPASEREALTGGVNNNDNSSEEQLVRNIILWQKPAPYPALLAPDRGSFLTGTMSHIVNHTAPGYQALPEFGAPGAEFEDTSEVEQSRIDTSKAGPATGSSEYSGEDGITDGESEGASESEREGSESDASDSAKRTAIEVRQDAAVQSTGESALATEPLMDSGRAEQKLARKPLPNDASELGTEIVRVGAESLHQGRGVGSLVGDLLSKDDLESWLGSLSGNGGQEQGDEAAPARQARQA